MRLKPMNPLPATALGAGIVVVGLVAWGPSRAGILDFFNPPKAAAAAQQMQTSEPLNPVPDLRPGEAPNYRAIVRQWGPAVVGVTVEGTRKMEGTADFGEDPFFQFFRGLPGLRMPPSSEQPFKGQGSGFIIGSNGLILTNAHVVRDAQQVTVKFADRRELTAKVLGSDPATDVAVLKVDARNLPTVKFGDPKTLQVGDYVLAIGAPFGFDESASAGIVSAKGRSLPGDAYVPFIQTDAAINPGNSGGPLFDSAGDVVGINAQIYSSSGGNQGLAFAIPIDVALHAKDQIVSTGHASHARLGVMVQDLNQALAESFGLERPDGALVSSVEPDTPAAKSGLKPGDVITAIDGAPVQRAGDLSGHIGMSSPGTRITLQVWRDHGSHDMSVKLVEAQLENEQNASSSGDRGEHAQLGLALRPMSPQERMERSVDHGLVVERVSGPAARAGIEPGDVLLGIDGLPADSVDQVRGALRGNPKSVALLIERNGERIFVPVRLG